MKFGEVINEYFVYKTVFGFSPFCFYYIFMKLFQYQQSKTKDAVKDINQNFTSNKLNEKKSEHPFIKLNWFLLKYFWEDGARQRKKYSPEVTEQFYQEAQIIF